MELSQLLIDLLLRLAQLGSSGIHGLLDLIVRLLILFFLGTTATVSSSPPPTVIYSGESDAVMKSYTTILEVDVIVMESFPPQVELHVRGEHPDGCELPVIVEEAHNDKQITIAIYRELPPDLICPMMLQPYEQTIRLSGTFDVGVTYTFDVNGFIIEREL